jgi:outer membrane protein assembly factor BamB
MRSLPWLAFASLLAACSSNGSTSDAASTTTSATGAGGSIGAGGSNAGGSGTGGASAAGGANGHAGGASGHAGGSNAGGAHQGGSGGAPGTGGAGGAPIACAPQSTKCAGPTLLETCNADGKGYTTTACPALATCIAGACTCSPGEVGCDGNTVVKCGQDGQPHPDKACPAGTTCSGGYCNDARCPDELNQAGSTGLPTAGWPRYRHDNRNSGTTDAAVADDPQLKWKVFVGGTTLNASGGLASGAVVNQNDVVFIGAGEHDGKGGLFYAFDGQGKPVYTFDGPRGYGWTTPAVRKDGTAYYSTQDGSAYAVKPDGTQLWKFSFGMQNDCNPIVTKDGYVIYGSDTGQLFALQANGTLLWQTDKNLGPGEVDNALAESCDGLILSGGVHGWFGLDAATGNTVWKVPAMALMSAPTVTADGTMFGVDASGVGWAIDKNGKVLWQKTLVAQGGATGTDLLYLAGRLFGVLADGALHAFDAATGDPIWAKPVGNAQEIYRHGAPVADAHHHLFFSSNDGNLYAFDEDGNALWKKPTSGVAAAGGNGYGSLAIGQDGTLYVPGNDGTLYAFQ